MKQQIQTGEPKYRVKGKEPEYEIFHIWEFDNFSKARKFFEDAHNNNWREISLSLINNTED